MGSTQGSTDLAVVGAGPGGYAAAFLAADLGLNVTLIDPEPNPGGVCLYRGCIPSKALLHMARLIGEAREAERWGVKFAKPRIDLDRLRSWKDGVVHKLTGGLGQLARKRRVRYTQGRAKLLGSGSLEIQTCGGASSRASFGSIVLATGSSSVRLPGLTGESPRILDSTTALQLTDIPGKLLVVGGGYIGLELGSVYAALGSKVTVVEMTSGLLPGVDRDLVRPLARKLESAFEEILLDTRVARFEERQDGVRVTLEGTGVSKPERTFDRVLVSVGRRSNSADLGLENTRAEAGKAGFVQVDTQLRTGEPGLSAIGDLVGQPMLAHKASHEGRVAVEAIAGRQAAFAPAAIPAVVFTDPEIAWCGLTEEEAKRQGRKVKVARFPWAASGRALSMDRTEGVTKLLVDPETERILGVGIAGSGAGEMIAEGVLAVEMAALATDLKLSIHPHPTLSETIMESAEVFFGQSTHVHRPRNT
ncbi:MAG: dihydrolipoyl dehydrogenase [Acidobacteriota bacterium]